MRHSYPLLISLLLLLLLIGPNYAAPYKNDQVLHWTITNKIDDARPIITINFGETPVTISDNHQLHYEDETAVDNTLPRFIPERLDPFTYQFTLPEGYYLFDRKYSLYTQAVDVDDNTVTVYIHFEIDTLNQDIYLLNPATRFFPGEARFGMAQQSTFDFSIYLSERPVDNCRWMFTSSTTQTINMNTNAATLYNQLTYRDDFTTKSSDGRTFTIEDFDMRYKQEGRLHTAIIVCRELNGEYSKDFVEIGYDTTPTTINFGLVENFINDPNRAWTNATVITNDPSRCTFTNPTYPADNTYYQYGIHSDDQFLPRPVIGSNSFSMTTNETFSFNRIKDIPPATTPPYTYVFNVTCENIAGHTSWTTARVDINFSNNLYITTLGPTGFAPSSGNEIAFIVNLPSAVCQVTLDGALLGTTDEGRERAVSIRTRLSEGQHNYTISCEATGGYNDQVTRSFQVDTQPPGEVNITGYDTFLCGQASFTAQFHAEDALSGIRHYHYLIKQNNQLFVEDNDTDGSISISNVNAQNNDRFTITVYAVDNAGNQGPPKTSSIITYKDMSDPACDRQRPMTWATLAPSPTGEGIIVTIACDDGPQGSGCKSIINSYTVPPEVPCGDNITLYTDKTKRLETPFTINDNVRLCWYVEDNANPVNRAFNQTSIAGNLGIAIHSPEFGISPNKTFDLVITTQQAATCKQGVYMDNIHKDMSAAQRYNSLGASSFFTQTGGTTHSIDDFTGIVSNDQSSTIKMLFACTVDNNRFDSFITDIGYDLTPPTITITLSPSLLRNPSSIISQINIAIDEPSLCTYERELVGVYEGLNQEDATEDFHDGAADFRNRDHYKQTYTSSLPEADLFDFPDFFTENEDYTYTATCTNLAGRTATNQAELIVDHASDVSITINAPDVVDKKQLTFNATTPHLQSTCTFSTDGVVWQDMTPRNERTLHLGTINFLRENYHTIVVACKAYDNPNLQGSATKRVLVDYAPPTIPEVTVHSPTCGLQARPEVRFQSEDNASGLSHYEYEITLNNVKTTHNTTTSNYFPLPVETPLAEGKNILLVVRAIDNAGWQSRPSRQETIMVTTTAYASCDRTPPTTRAILRPSPSGESHLINFTCEDPGGSGCDKDVYTYKAASLQEQCSNNVTRYAKSTYEVNKEYEIKTRELICYYVQDKQGNKAYSSALVQASLDITITNPRFGISPIKTFDFSVQTAEAASCRQGEYLSTYTSRTSARDLYESLVAKGESSLFRTTGGTTHTTTNFRDLSGTSEERTVDWLIACRSTAGTLYGAQKTPLGYDTTPPVITVTLNTDNPLIEPNVDHATMTVKADDESLCTYLQPIIVPYPLPGMQPAPFRYNFNSPQSNQHSDLLNRNHYRISYSTRIPEHDERYLYSGTYTTYPYKVLCTNLAGLQTEETYEVIMDPVNTLAITIHTPRQAKTKQVTINATTILKAACEFTINNLEARAMQTRDNRYHYQTITLQDNAQPYDLIIRCVSTESAQIMGTAQSTITIDTTPPSITNITAIGSTCGLDARPSIRLQSTDGEEGTGIDHYEYTITTGRTTTTHTTTSERFDLPLDLPLQAGTKYDLKARAHDRAGNTGGWSTTKTITATDENDVLCDETNPFGWPERRDTPQGADVIIHCTDTGSGCADTYRYSFVTRGTACTAASYQTSTPGMNGDAYTKIITVTNDQLLCWQVSDKAGNTYTAPQPLDLTVSMDITLAEPRFGIGPTTTYDLTYTTSASATCKAGFQNPNSPATLELWYGQLTMTFDTPPGSTHTINDFNIIERGASACAGKEACTQPLVIICNENGRYHYAVHQVGFDTSDPRFIMAEARPNPVRTPGNLQSTLYVETDDRTWCRYVREDNGESYSFAQNPDINDRNQYVTEQERFLGYFSPPPGEQDSYTIDYELTCVNLAGRSVKEDITLTIAPTTQVGITITNEDAYPLRGVALEATTNLPSSCSYAFNPNHPPQPFRTTGGTTHTTSHSFPTDGEYDLIVYCEALSGPYVESATKQIIIDATGPRMLEIISQKQTCSLGSITATFISNATIIGLKSYNYSITDKDGNLLIGWKTASASGTLQVNEQLTLTAGQTYRIQAQAIDNFDRKSSIISASVTAQDDKHKDCDNEPPTATITLEEVYAGYDAYVACEDGGSGCTSTFDFQHAAQNCNGTYTPRYYTNQPQKLKSSGIACAIVYDNAGLSGTDSKRFTIIDHCSNRIQDPEEEGIDCGGPCPASCDRCTNGRQDTNEEGIDCGGVCPRSCDQVCGDGKVTSPEACDSGVGTLTCKTFGFFGGTLECSDQCVLDTGSCVPTNPGFCGDGIIQPNEECDGNNMQDLACEDFGLISGKLTCTNCELSTKTCEGPTGGFCGDGIIQPGEKCDGTFQGMTCESFGLISGTLICNNDCTITTEDCYEGYCGDGEIDRGESCDGREWGDIRSCADLSTDFIGGMPVCGPNCQFNTETCEARQAPGTSSGAFCLADTDCPYNEECKDNACKTKPTTIKKTDPETGEGSACTNDGDCPLGYDCLFGECTPSPSTPTTPPKKHTLGWSFIISGLVFLLAGAGYLIYTTFINPPAPTQPTPGTSSTPGQPGYPETPTEDPERRAARLAAEKKRLLLQQEAKKKAQEDKIKQRKALLSSFEGDELAQKGKEENAITQDKEETTPSQEETEEPEKKPSKKLVKPQDEDIFNELESITKGTAPKAASTSTEDIFDDLAELSKSPKSKLKTTIKTTTTADDLVKLFQNAERKDMNAKNLTPVFKHFIGKGTLEHDTVHETVHKLHEQDKITYLQKEKILKDLKNIGEQQ